MTKKITRSPMLFPLLFLFLLLSLAGALIEGLWGAVPPVLVQFNGLVLLLSALVVLGVTASNLLRRSS